MAIIDKMRVQRCFSRALTSYAQNATAQQQINCQLWAMLAKHRPLSVARALEIGCGTGDLTRLLVPNFPDTDWLFNDLSPTALSALTDEFSGNYRYLAGDAEQLSPKSVEKLDLIASGSTVQWFEQPKRLIDFAQQSLNKDGLLLFNTFLPDHFAEIKQLTNAGLNYPTQAEWQHWLAPHFEILEQDTTPIRLHFAEPKAVLRHLKQTGVTATNKIAWTKGQLKAFTDGYWQKFSNHEQVYLTYSPLLILAKRK